MFFLNDVYRNRESYVFIITVWFNDPSQSFEFMKIYFEELYSHKYVGLI